MSSTSASRESRTNFSVRYLLLPFLLALLWVGSGCSGYRLGPTTGLPPGESSVQVVPFVNNTLEPRLTDAVTFQLRRSIQRDGTFRLATGSEADIQVSGTIVQYDRQELSLSPRDTLTVRDYRLSLTAQVSALDRRSGQVLFEQPVKGYTLVRVGSDLVSSERQALPLLAQDLARNVTALLAEGSW